MAQVAARKKVATQMGNQGHAGEGIRTTVEWVRSGVLGDITEVHTWTNRPVWGSQGNRPIEEAPKPGSTVSLTLDRQIQTAAEDALEPLAQQAMLVAVQPSTGGILAVAQNAPADAAGALALTGRFPPGSSFKIVTSLAGVACAGDYCITQTTTANIRRYQLP